MGIIPDIGGLHYPKVCLGEMLKAKIIGGKTEFRANTGQLICRYDAVVECAAVSTFEVLHLNKQHHILKLWHNIPDRPVPGSLEQAWWLSK